MKITKTRTEGSNILCELSLINDFPPVWCIFYWLFLVWTWLERSTVSPVLEGLITLFHEWGCNGTSVIELFSHISELLSISWSCEYASTDVLHTRWSQRQAHVVKDNSWSCMFRLSFVISSFAGIKTIAYKANEV